MISQPALAEVPARPRSCTGRIESSPIFDNIDKTDLKTAKSRSSTISEFRGGAKIAPAHQSHGSQPRLSIWSSILAKSGVNGTQKRCPMKAKQHGINHGEVQEIASKSIEGESPPDATQLPLSPTVKTKNTSEMLLTIDSNILVKRPIGFENDKISLPFRSKRLRTCTESDNCKAETPSTSDLNKYKGPKTRLAASPSTFNKSRWSNTDWSPVIEFHSGRSLTDTVEITPRSGGYFETDLAEFESVPRSFPVLPSNSAYGEGNFRSSIAGASKPVSALQLFNEIITDCNAKERFDTSPQQCIANASNGSRCGSRMRREQEKQNRIEVLLCEISSKDFEASIHDSADKLRQLTELAICRYQKDSTLQSIEILLQSHLVDWRESFDGKKCEHEPLNEVETVSKFFMTEGKRIDHAPGLALKYLGQKSLQDLDKWWDTSEDKLHYLSKYIPYHSDSEKKISLSRWIMRQAGRPLSNPNKSINQHGELRSGYLYTYWNRATFGLAKIGSTARTVEIRFEEWGNMCHRPVEEQYRSKTKVKNVARLEKIVHAELRDYRVYEQKCRGCNGKHIEWFKDVERETILECIDFWTRWIMDEPYEKKGREQWHLKQDLTCKLAQICITRSELHAQRKKLSVVPNSSRPFPSIIR